MAFVSCKGSSEDKRAGCADTIAESIGDSTTLAGRWIRIAPDTGAKVGFDLRVDSTAKSISGTSVLYSAWHLLPGKDSLLIVARTGRNGLSVTDTMRFAYKHSGDTLTLFAHGRKPEVYLRKK